MKYCSGCGVTLQSKNSEEVGYIPLSSMGKEDVQCRRCFRIRHYGEIQAVSQTEGDFVALLKDLKKKKCLIVYIVDLFDLEGSIIPNSIELLQNKPIIMIGNKVDLFPQSVKKERLRKYIVTFAQKKGINLVGSMVCSAENGENIAGIADAIEKQRQGRDVYVIGTTNVGKSTFMNRIIPLLGEGAGTTITTSAYPGTTLDTITIPLQDGKELVDTPGFLRKNTIYQLLSPEEYKIALPRKEIHPKVYQLSEQQTLFLGGLVRMDFIKGDKQSFSLFVSNQLYLHRTKLENADALFASQRGQLLVPPQDPDAIPSWKQVTFDLKGDQKEDITISGLGWISGGKEKATLTIHVPEGIDVQKRPALV